MLAMERSWSSMRGGKSVQRGRTRILMRGCSKVVHLGWFSTYPLFAFGQ